jgi:hypothetical protein
MNKQELIERIEDFPCEASLVTEMIQINKNTLLGWVKQLDEPQKVTVPQIVADYIEYTKATDWDLQEAMDDVAYEDNKDLRKWFNDNIETFARAWLDGYTVEKEKRYYVRFKWIEESYSYLTLIKYLNAWTLHSITLDKKFRTEHTKKQLEEAGFGWVFDCTGIEIEEVE